MFAPVRLDFELPRSPRGSFEPELHREIEASVPCWLRIDPRQRIPYGVKDWPERLVDKKDEIDVLGVPRGWREDELVQRSPSAEGQAVSQELHTKELDQSPADYEILLNIVIVRPRRMPAPFRDLSGGDHLVRGKGPIDEHVPAFVALDGVLGAATIERDIARSLPHEDSRERARCVLRADDAIEQISKPLGRTHIALLACNSRELVGVESLREIAHDRRDVVPPATDSGIAGSIESCLLRRRNCHPTRGGLPLLRDRAGVVGSLNEVDSQATRPDWTQRGRHHHLEFLNGLGRGAVDACCAK